MDYLYQGERYNEADLRAFLADVINPEYTHMVLNVAFPPVTILGKAYGVGDLLARTDPAVVEQRRQVLLAEAVEDAQTILANTPLGDWCYLPFIGSVCRVAD